jgi:outer membrane lipoprotein SlyB
MATAVTSKISTADPKKPPPQSGWWGRTLGNVGAAVGAVVGGSIGATVGGVLHAFGVDVDAKSGAEAGRLAGTSVGDTIDNWSL